MIVAHEMIHAALRTLELGFGKRLSGKQEELLPERTEWLVTQF
ncbi:hypothetical protein V5E97_19030 [Singulisphaera sp. Ch08]|uniref:Uncharacterized protein n=1 Tax=Singulisphaera sp. Ch08 TaxID=3120278 RepID=A0AAU7CRE7_9BACT